MLQEQQDNMTSSMEDLKLFQQELDNNEDMRQGYINSKDNSDTSSESEDDILTPKYGNVPVYTTKSIKPIKQSTKNLLLRELIKQQKLTMKAEKQNMRLQNEIDLEEVKTRYLKLDLNNAQVKLEEEKEKIEEVEGELRGKRSENLLLKVMFICSVFWSVGVQSYWVYTTYK